MDTLDANIFARDTDPTDPLYPVCHALLEVLDQRRVPIIVPNLVLAEVAAAVSRTRRDPIRARIVVAALADFEHVQLIPLDNLLAQEAAELAGDRALRGADAVYAAVARRYGCALVSLDREQCERAAPLVRTLTPAEALAELNDNHLTSDSP
jgi:predicted nucleic acid-binding protein